MSSSSLEKEARLYCCFRTSRRLACLSSCSSTSEKSKFAHRTGKFIGLTITMGPWYRPWTVSRSYPRYGRDREVSVMWFAKRTKCIILATVRLLHRWRALFPTILDCKWRNRSRFQLSYPAACLCWRVWPLFFTCCRRRFSHSITLTFENSLYNLLSSILFMSYSWWSLLLLSSKNSNYPSCSTDFQSSFLSRPTTG